MKLIDSIHFKQLASNQRSGSSLKYKVLQKDDKAHIVQMNIQPVKRYGYVIFANSVGNLPGPIRRISGAHLIIMAETRIGSGDLHIAVSSPDLNFNMSSSRTNRPLNKSSDLTGDEIFFLNSVPVNVQVNLRRAVHFHPESVMVNGDVIGQADTYVELVQKAPNLCKFSSPCAKQIQFKNLVKGFTTEVHLTYVRPTPP